MKNKTGSPVEGDDFFDRERELASFQRNLENEADLLLTAPRRVGKTSFVLRLCERWKGMPNRKAAFCNVEACHDEFDFAESLIDALRKEHLQADWLPRIADGFRKFREQFKGIKVGAGVNVEITGVPDLDHTTLSRLLESILERVQKSGLQLLIAVDELPELLLSIAGLPQGDERVRGFLHWLRSLRQSHSKNIRWIFLGSIGLDSFVEMRQFGDTINDLTVLPLGAFDDASANAFLEKLGTDNGLPLSPAVRNAIIAALGWSLPYHLQLMFHAFVELQIQPTGPDDVQSAIEHLLRPEHASYFDTWRQRLRDQFGADQLSMALQLLKLLCQHPSGLSRHQLLDALMATRPHGEAIDVDQQLGALLLILQRDGYLIWEGDRYGFRSFLLREYWRRRES